MNKVVQFLLGAYQYPFVALGFLYSGAEQGFLYGRQLQYNRTLINWLSGYKPAEARASAPRT